MIDSALFENINEITLTDSRIKYDGTQALPLLEIDSPLCQATISLYGGQILAFKPHSKRALLWLSPLAEFKRGKSIRGGIPICAPWFGKHSQPNFPNHGFARTSDWQLSRCEKLANGHIVIELTLLPNEQSIALGYEQFTMSVSFELGETLVIKFSMSNHYQQQSIDCGWALHSYFNVDSITNTQVQGLDGLSYRDATRPGQQFFQTGDLIFDQEIDRYFINGTKVQTINNEQLITIEGQHCNTTITWNPGQQLAQKMPDIGGENFDQFVCVERGAAFDDSWVIQPQTTTTAILKISQTSI